MKKLTFGEVRLLRRNLDRINLVGAKLTYGIARNKDKLDGILKAIKEVEKRDEHNPKCKSKRRLHACRGGFPALTWAPGCNNNARRDGRCNTDFG